ncbi:MAG: 2-oxoglutarate dehydrogenase E1 subunit family protein, partial [Rhodococcus sp. (in: high G+C Gram-positive bacteria)]
MSSSSTTQFGQNQWLVDEMYQRFKKDPSSVDASWHEFLTGYDPDAATDENAGSGASDNGASGNGASGNGASDNGASGNGA